MVGEIRRKLLAAGNLSYLALPSPVASRYGLIMKIAVIACARNRGCATLECFQSIEDAISNAAPVDAGMIVVGDGSTRETAATLNKLKVSCSCTIELLLERKKQLSSARICGLRSVRSDLLEFIEKAICANLVLHGGRTELGEPTDLPIADHTPHTPMRWCLEDISSRHPTQWPQHSDAHTLVDRLGPFDERLRMELAALGVLGRHQIQLAQFAIGATREQD